MSGTAVALPGANRVDSNDLKKAAVTKAKIAKNAINSSKVARNSLRGEDLAPGSVSSSNLAGNAVNASNVAPESIGAAHLGPGSVGTSEFSTLPAARVQDTAGTSIPELSAGDGAAVGFNTESPTGVETQSTFDNGNLHSPADDTRLTAPIPGVYSITGSVVWGLASPDDGWRFISITLNDVDNPIAVESAEPPAGTGLDQSVHTIARLNAGDFVQLFAAQENSTDDPIDIVPFNGTPAFAMAWLSP